MTNLLLALLAFTGTHILMSHPLRAALAARMSVGAFQIVYSIVAFATFGWAVVAFRAAPFGEPLWRVGDGLWAVSTVLMLAASILLLGSVVRNPALPTRGIDKLTSQPARGVFAITRHPMLWSFALWALSHVLISPRPAVLMLCAFMGALALGGAAGQDVKKAKLMGDGWRDWASRTSFWPFGGQIAGRISWGAAVPGMHALGGGLVVWLLATWLHPMAGAGVSAGIWRWF